MNYIGDVLFTTPALAALRRGYPEAEMTVLVGPRAREILAANPAITRLVERPRARRARWRLLRQFRAQQFDLAVSFSSRSVEYAAWTRLLGCPRRWGFDRPDTRWFLNGRLKEDTGRHWSADYLALACAAGGQEAGRLPRLHLTPAEEAWAVDALPRLGVDPERFRVGVLMGASYPEKCWRPERFAELARLGAAHRDAQIVAFGGLAEAELGEWLTATVPNAVNLAGQFSLRQYMAAVRCCAAFVGADSGPTHIAAALGVPTIALYGFTDPARTGTVGERVTVLGDGKQVRASRRSKGVPYEYLDPITAPAVWETICRWHER